MLKIKSVLLLLILFQVIPIAPLEASSGARKHFLSHGPSVQSYGRGETATAFMADDISGYFYNPSNIGRIKRGSLSVAHYILYDGAMYNFFSLGLPSLSDRAILGLSGINLRSGDIELREKIDSNPRVVQTSQWLVTGTFAADLRDSLGILAGLNLNYLYFDFQEGVSAGNIGVDAGVSRSFKGPFILGNRSSLHLGLAGQSVIRPVLKLKNEKEVYPTTGRLGVALSLPMFFRYNPTKQTFHYDKANIYLDTVYDQDIGDVGLLWGFEYLILNRYAIRCGFNETLTLGAGARSGDYQFNYAIDFKPYTYFHRIGVAFYWGEVEEEEDEDFAHFMAVYQRVERLAAIQLKTARELIDKRNYDSAIDILERSQYLLPDKNLETVNLLKQARDLSVAQKVVEARNKAMEEFQRGDILSAWRTLVESLNISGDNPDTKALIERMTAEAAKRGLKINQLKQDTVDTLVAQIKSDLSFEDFESAQRNLSKLKTLDGESFVFYDIKKQIEEAKKNYVSSNILKAENELLPEKKNYSESIIAAERALAIEPDNERAQGLRRKAGEMVMKKKKISTKDRLYSERLYYTAAEHFAKNEDRKAKEVIFELIRFNPAQGYAYPLFFRLTKEEEKKKRSTDIKLKDDELDALKYEYEKALLENRIKEFVLAAKLSRQEGDIVKAYQLYLNGYDLNPDDEGICLELRKIYEEVKPKKKTRQAAPRPGEWMEMAYEAEQERGGYRLPSSRREDAQEFKEIEKIRADYINSVRRRLVVLASKGDYTGLERSLKKLKLFMSEDEIEKLLFLLKR